MALGECHRLYKLGEPAPDSLLELAPVWPKSHPLAPNSRKNPIQSSEIIGQCKLCLKEKQLHQSHLMPSALYAPGKKGIQFATRSKFGNNPEHLKACLLCFECEQRLDRLGESEVLRWLPPKARKQFPLHDRLWVALPCGEIPPYSI